MFNGQLISKRNDTIKTISLKGHKSMKRCFFISFFSHYVIAIMLIKDMSKCDYTAERERERARSEKKKMPK